MKYFAFGILFNGQLAGEAVGSNIRYKSLYQFVPAVGTGIRLAGGIVRFGYSLQYVNQASGDLTVDSNVDPLGYNQGLAQGAGLSHNVGFALTLPIAYLPAFNAVARNVGNLTYSSSTLLPLARNDSGPPATEPMTVDVSLSIQPKIGSGSYMNWVVEYRDATNTTGVPMIGRFAVGAEISVRDSFYIRGGFGSGYPAAGIGLRRKGGEFSLTWHSEEIGGGYRIERDTRYLMQYQVKAF
jgi:hypothetical protein